MSRDVASALTPGSPAWVENGARLSGARANAVVTIDPFEHERRMQAHLGAVTDLALLDLFLTLPQGWPVATTALDPEALDHLRRAPRGCWTGDHGVDIVRLLQRPCQVETVVVDGDRWHKSLETARRGSNPCRCSGGLVDAVGSAALGHRGVAGRRHRPQGPGRARGPSRRCGQGGQVAFRGMGLPPVADHYRIADTSSGTGNSSRSNRSKFIRTRS
jgi:hypothetical protein